MSFVEENLYSESHRKNWIAEVVFNRLAMTKSMYGANNCNKKERGIKMDSKKENIASMKPVIPSAATILGGGGKSKQ